MGVFDNEKYFDKEAYNELSFIEQRDLFLKIRSWVPDTTKQVRADKAKFRKLVLKRIEQVITFAVEGNIPAQDYLGYIYKRGFDDFFPINYRRALEWNILAASNGSKFAPQKMKAFLNPAIDMILLSEKWPQLVEFNNLHKGNYFWFLSQYVCDILRNELKLSEVAMMKKPIVEEDLNETGTIVYLDRLRNRCVMKAIDVLEKQLPPNMVVKDVRGVAEDILKAPDDDDSDDDIDIGLDKI